MSNYSQKYRVFLQGFPGAMVTWYVIKMTAFCSAIMDVSHGSLSLLLQDISIAVCVEVM